MGADQGGKVSQNSADSFAIKRGKNVLSSPRVSVVMPAYNAARFIPFAIRSVEDQTFAGHELIVVNDGSPDSEQLEAALAPFFDDIVYVEQANLGAGPARNRAISLARGELIAFLDADDEWLPDFLAHQISMIDGGWDMVYADAELFGDAAPSDHTFMESAPSSGEVTASSLLDFRCNVITSGTVAKKAAIIAAGAFEKEDTRAQDFHLWIRMAKAGSRIGYSDKVLLRYRVHTENLSGDSISRVEREIAVFQRVKKTIDLSPEELSILERQLSGLRVDLEIEKGKSHLVNRDFAAARDAFSHASAWRPSAKLKAVCLAARFAPSLLLRIYRSKHSDHLGLIRNEAAASSWTAFSVISALLRLFSE